MDKNIAVIMFGLPAAGKSTWIDSYLKEFPETKVVCADKIKEKIMGYNPEFSYLVHQESVELAKREVLRLATLAEDRILMDGGGINNNYTKSIIIELKKLGYYVKLVHIDTPLKVCLERNQLRKDANLRFVPEEEIIKKSNKLISAYHNIIDLVDEVERVSYYTDTHVFIDMDGVVAAYQTLQRDEYGNVDFVNNKVFLYAPPVMPVIEKLRADQLRGKKLYILSASANSICNEEKLQWLSKYMAFINPNDVYFVGNKEYKVVMLEALLKKLAINKKDCVLIDDWHDTIDKGLKRGIKVIHPSNYLAVELN